MIEETNAKFTVIGLIVLMAISVVLWGSLRSTADPSEASDVKPDSNVSHSFKYETLAPMADFVESSKNLEDVPYDGYGHGMPAGSETDDPSYYAYTGREVSFSKPSGAYAESFLLTMRAPEGYTIYYTEDGSDPTPESTPYTHAIQITDTDGMPDQMISAETTAKMDNYDFGRYKAPNAADVASATVIRARAFSDDGQSTDVGQRTYFVGKSISERYGGIAVISITTDYANLFDYNIGIFASGFLYDTWRTSPEAQLAIANKEFWTPIGNYSARGDAWERPATIEMFDGTDSLTFSEDVGIRSKGGTSRSAYQKSLNVFFRKTYGQKSLSYELFDSALDMNGDAIGEYKDFTLRNGGSESVSGLKFRDSYLQSLLTGMDFATQASRPAVVFLNGEYWGVYTLCTRYDDDMMASEYGVSKDNVIIVKNEEIEDGEDADLDLYDELMAYADEDLSEKSKWEAFKQICDVQSMADYYAAEIYIGNADWFPSRNYGVWRTREWENDQYGDGRWRWILYDTEISSNLVPSDEPAVKVDFDHFAQAVNAHPLFAAALQNAEFRSMFLESMKTVCDKKMEYGRAMARLMDYMEVWWPLMDDHYKRFGDPTQALYRKGLSQLSSFIEKRRDVIMPIIEDALSDYPAYYEKLKEQAAEVEAEHPAQEMADPNLNSSSNVPNANDIVNEIQENADPQASQGVFEQNPATTPESSQIDSNGNYPYEIRQT